ncbi:sugar phosphate isomerase/epimerase family protein [Desertivirga xinjiangensis]|uniref:sugar phosphate isomerase/epimerase family protein n=1 Tax=Desertivirga xinjiangensis TaxID=539206 RepID=UPI00210DECC0|nr:sugar phosphate isomerase/epimerase family protein [Pedobacter xinjiangensis]
MPNYSRRSFLNSSLLAAAALSLKSNAFGSVINGGDEAPQEGYRNPVVKPQICIFSKHLHWISDYYEMASFAADLGFDGIDLTVRKNGHVSPERVKEDLPRAKTSIEKAGLKVHMLTTDIVATSSFTEDILKTAAGLGIPSYRMGWIPYKPDAAIPEQIKSVSSQLATLAAMNKKYGIRGEYQNHSGTNFGASVWDIWLAIKDIDPRYLGCQFDILHATVEGANSWKNDLKLLKDYIQTIDIKDFHWENNEGKWGIKKVPLGSGMVNFKNYFSLIKQYGITGPLSMHFEYPLGGAESGSRKLSISRQEAADAMKKDLNKLKEILKEAGLI